MLKSEKWTDAALEKAMTFCILDKMVDYDRVTKTFKDLDRRHLTERGELKRAKEKDLQRILKDNGYRFHGQTAKALYRFGQSTVDLRTASRPELMKALWGVGMKLASLFVRETRGQEVAVLDVHTKRWMKERGLLTDDYVESEMLFIEEAKALGLTAEALDKAIWETYRRKAKG